MHHFDELYIGDVSQPVSLGFLPHSHGTSHVCLRVDDPRCSMAVLCTVSRKVSHCCSMLFESGMAFNLLARSVENLSAMLLHLSLETLSLFAVFWPCSLLGGQMRRFH
jgi:hypothetical protein